MSSMMTVKEVTRMLHHLLPFREVLDCPGKPISLLLLAAFVYRAATPLHLI